jgi:hypothetical protein
VNTRTEIAQAAHPPLARGLRPSTVQPPSNGRPPKLRHSLWSIIIVATILGYLALSRAFAYLGIISLNIFVGEVVLGGALLSGKLAIGRRWVRSIKPQDPLQHVAITMALFLGYGFFEEARGLSAGYPTGFTLKNLAFNYYPIYIWLGLWLGGRDVDMLRRIIRLSAWINGVYGLSYLLVLGQAALYQAGTKDVPFFGQPTSYITLLGLLCFEPRLRSVWHLLVMNTVVLLGVQVRGEWVAFLVALFVLGFYGKRLGNVFAGILACGSLLALGYWADISIPAPLNRGGVISTRAIISRALAPIDPALAAEYSENADFYAGTYDWRTVWWNAIWKDVNSNGSTMVFGRGYGYPVYALSPEVLAEDVRTPHSWFWYSLSYGGWAGVFAFSAFQLALGAALFRNARRTRQYYGFALWCGAMINGLFGSTFDAPFGCIPLYILFGMTLSNAEISPSAILGTLRRTRRRQYTFRRARAANAGSIGWSPAPLA